MISGVRERPFKAHPKGAVWLLWRLSLDLPADSYQSFYSFPPQLCPPRWSCSPFRLSGLSTVELRAQRCMSWRKRPSNSPPGGVKFPSRGEAGGEREREREKKRRWHRRLDCPSVEQTRAEVSHSPLTSLLPGGKNILGDLRQNVQPVCTLKTHQRPNVKKVEY